MTSLLLGNARPYGAEAAGTVDIRVAGGIVAELAPALRRKPGEELIDCGGATVLPGLTDHHLHLHAMAAARTSVRCGPPDVTTKAGLAAVLGAAEPDEHGWIRGTGYVESVAGDLDAATLDQCRADCPVRVQHRSGALWSLNTAALVEVGLLRAEDPGQPGIERDAAGRPTGRLWRADAWLRDRLPRRPLPGLAVIGAELRGHGITAVTDATPDLTAEAITALSDALRAGQLPPRVHLLGVPLGAEVPETPGLTVGPYKIVLADSGLPAYPDLVERIAAAHAAGRPVAVHCVTREALILLTAALTDVGTVPGDRIEHAALVPAELLRDLARLGVRVVTQPGFLAARGDDFLRDVPPAEHQDLYRCATIRAAGIPLALSSDAPYGPLSPWTVIAAAATRQTPAGQTASPAERLTIAQALSAYLSPPEAPGAPVPPLRPGTAANLVLLNTSLADLQAAGTPVRRTLVTPVSQERCAW